MEHEPSQSPHPPLPSPAPPAGATLRRDLGLWMAIAVVIGNTIGSGIFVKPGRIAADAGSFPLIISIWLIGAALCILGGFCLAELSSMHPQAGGIYVYLKQAYGRWVAFLFGWQEFLFARPASTGALAVVCVASIAHCGGWNVDIFTSVVAAIAIVGSLTVVNIVGVLWGGWTQAITTIVKCGMVLAIALSPWLFEIFGFDVAQLSNYSQKVTPQREGFAAQAAAVLLAVMWAFNGWEGVVPVAEEVREVGVLDVRGHDMRAAFVHHQIQFGGPCRLCVMRQHAGQQGHERVILLPGDKSVLKLCRRVGRCQIEPVIGDDWIWPNDPRVALMEKASREAAE